MDEGKINCIVFLDIRKAFDSINHNILLSKMRSNVGISGNELLWFESYLTDREQQCVANGILSPGVDPGAAVIFALHQRPITMSPKNHAGSIC
jgi:hypothetical protein